MLSARPPGTVKLFFVLDEQQAGRISSTHRLFGLVEIRIRGSLEVELI